MQETFQLLPILLVSGVLAGLLAGLFGVGGGLVVVPSVCFILLHLGLPTDAAMSSAVCKPSDRSLIVLAWVGGACALNGNLCPTGGKGRSTN